MSKKRIVIGNWKMFMESPVEAAKFAKALRAKARSFVGVDAWLAPAHTLLAPVAQILKGSSVRAGAQSVSAFDEAVSRAHTGEISAQMLKSAGASFVLVGHSERRIAGESDDAVRAQLAAALHAGLTVVLCVGERERQPDGSHFAEVANQLSRALYGAPAIGNKLVVAYEPVWAIGKSADHAMKGEELEEVAIFIRKILSETLGREAVSKVPVLYGGAVEPTNAAAIVMQGGVQGLLVGHASADVNSFIEILKACRK